MKDTVEGLLKIMFVIRDIGQLIREIANAAKIAFIFLGVKRKLKNVFNLSTNQC